MRFAAMRSSKAGLHEKLILLVARATQAALKVSKQHDEEHSSRLQEVVAVGIFTNRNTSLPSAVVSRGSAFSAQSK